MNEKLSERMQNAIHGLTPVGETRPLSEQVLWWAEQVAVLEAKLFVTEREAISFRDRLHEEEAKLEALEREIRVLQVAYVATREVTIKTMEQLAAAQEEGAGRMSEKKYRANFLWPHEDGSVEAAGYEFANASSSEGQRVAWNELIALVSAPIEAKLEAMEQDTVAWRQSWRDAKDQATELATAILEAPYTAASLEKWNAFTRMAHGIVGDPAAQEEQRE